MTTSNVQALVQEQSLAPLASDIPVGMTLAEYRRVRAVPSPRERTRVALLGRPARPLR